MSQTPDVIQGRLGWEDGDISEASPEELDPHPKNQEIYGDTADADDLDSAFIESVREKGVLEPLVITDGKQIISGHRRWLAAKATDADSVPVRKSTFDSDLAEREALIEFNRQREKSRAQKVNEIDEIKDVIQVKDGSDRTTDKQSDRWEEKAIERIDSDISASTYRKGKAVKEKANSEAEPEQVREAAKEAWEDLQSNEQSFNSAYNAVKEAERGCESPNSESDDDTGADDAASTENSHDLDVLTSDESDEWSSPRELVEPLDAAVGGFDLDPCSGAESSPFAAETYTAADDGLAQPWHGDVWVNPPYSEMWDWTDKAIEAVSTGDAETVCFLCKGDSSTDWWQCAASHAAVICAIDHRLSFGDGDSSAPFASHVVVFGALPEALRAALEEFGTLLYPEVSE
jgi:phage N-6-adenine-methyltransferase